MKSGNQGLLDAQMRSFEQQPSNGEQRRRPKAMPYHNSRTRDWNEKDIIAIALTTASISFAAALDDLKRRLPRALYPLGDGAMTTKEAFDIVLSLAFDNMADEEEMPEIYREQSEALEIVTEIAKYYGARRK
jgi:hypothetical protein